MQSLVARNLSILILMMFFAPLCYGDFSLLRMQTNGYYATQQSGGNAFSVQASWTPYFIFSERLYLRGNFGAVPLKSSSSSTFVAYNAQILMGYGHIISNLGIEVGGGIETWIEPGKIYPMVGLNLPWVFDKPWGGYIDRGFFGFSLLNLSQFNTTYECKLGVGLSF